MEALANHVWRCCASHTNSADSIQSCSGLTEGQCRALCHTHTHTWLLTIDHVYYSSQSVRASLLNSLSSMGEEVLSAFSRPEWLPLLHSIALLHATTRLRGEAYDYAWAETHNWTHNHLMVLQNRKLKRGYSAGAFSFVPLTSPCPHSPHLPMSSVVCFEWHCRLKLV